MGFGEIGFQAGAAGTPDNMNAAADKQIQYQQDSRNQDAQIKKQQMQSHKFLIEMGIAEDKVIPPSSTDLENTLKEFSKSHGADINFNMAKDASEEDKQKFLYGLMQMYKVPPPKPNIKTEYHMEKARDLGAKMSSDGTASVSPSTQPKSVLEQANEWKQAQGIIDASGIKATPGTNSKGQIQLKPESSTTQTRDYTKKEATDILKGIKDGNVSAIMTGMGRTGVAAEVARQAAAEGYDLKSKQLEMTGLIQLTKTMNSNQMVQLNTAFNSLEKDLPLLSDANKEFQRSNIKLGNKLVIEARQNGIGLKDGTLDKLEPDQAKSVQKFITQLNLTRDNMAVAFMRGGVPTDQAFKLTADIFNPILGGDLTQAAIDQVQKNLDLRKNVFQNYSQWNQGGKSVTDVAGITKGGSSGQTIGRFQVKVK